MYWKLFLLYIDIYNIHQVMLTYSQVSAASSAVVASSSAVYQGGGVSEIIVGANMGYFIDTSVSQLYAHQTGPTWPLPDKELKRKVLIMSGYMKDEPTFPELRLLQKGSFGSEFYHYKMDASGHTVYDNCEPEKEDRIDTDCEEAPNILAGPLTQDSLRPLKKLVKEVYKLGTMVFTDVAADVSSVNASNLRQALGNMVKYQHIQGSRKLRELNDHMRTDGSNPDRLPC